MFNVPGTPFSSPESSNIDVRDAYFRCKDPRHLSDLVQKIETLRRQVTCRELEKAERATLVTQEKLQLGKFKPIMLSGLWIRPTFYGWNREGTLEAHANGFRYSTSSSSRSDEGVVDIMYANVKHAFHHPAMEKKMVALLHFHLHNHIMVGNKKTKDFQFSVQVIELVKNLWSSKIRINTDFQNFVNRTNVLWGQPQFQGLQFIEDGWWEFHNMFIEDGRWEFLNMEDLVSDSDNSQESSHHGYESDDGQSESEDEDDSEELLLVEYDDKEEDDSDEGSEEEASKADREKGAEEESDSEEEESKRRSNTNNHHHQGGMAKRPKFR
ncbi:FACT complex subunit SPT16-like [Impatiens glandulifera]|uniref:FACT complex subunit SPT16-like n=1 Tax=Impatiens glandulifera TaxID=253017 RepID=UPI001FB0A1F7|nr:FACT complex subunit SPT16-like [Impatiens glandulifera]